jgi:hypothetical protein
MSNIIVRTTPKNRISINTPKQTSVKTLTGSGQSTNRLRNLVDVDGSSLNNNETVVYDEARDEFVVKELPIVNGGEF